MAERAAMMSWYDEMVTARRSKSLTTGNVRCGVAAVHEALASLASKTPVNCHCELSQLCSTVLLSFAKTPKGFSDCVE